MRWTVVSALVCVATGWLHLTSAQCPNGVRPRREWRMLTYTEQQNYLWTVKQVMNSGVYDQLVTIHADFADSNHGNAVFLPWHRAFIARFEQELQKRWRGAMLPYWDWSLDSQFPELSAVWDWVTFGYNGFGPDSCVDLSWSWLGGYRPKYNGDHCLRRSWNYGDSIGSFTSPDLLNANLAAATSFRALARVLEGGPHGGVHNNIGGDLSTMASPADPLFWLHHANLDRLWYNWQYAKPNLFYDYGGFNSQGLPASYSDPLVGLAQNGVQPRVADTFITMDFCYYYQEMDVNAASGAMNNRRRLVRRDPLTGESTTIHIPPPPNRRLYRRQDPTAGNTTDNAPSSDRVDLVHLLNPHPLSDNWITINKLNAAEVRQTEAEANAKCTELNALTDTTGYISPAALLNQPEQLGKLLATGKVKKFVARIKGKNVEADAVPDVSKLTEDLLKKAEVAENDLQPEVDDFAADLVKIIGPPMSTAPDSPSNPFKSRKKGGKGYALGQLDDKGKKTGKPVTDPKDRKNPAEPAASKGKKTGWNGGNQGVAKGKGQAGDDSSPPEMPANAGRPPKGRKA